MGAFQHIDAKHAEEQLRPGEPSASLVVVVIGRSRAGAVAAQRPRA
jgi:hypothetical protein